MSITLNAGNLFDESYLDTVIKWNEEFHNTVQVTSLFGSVAGLTPTARSADRLPYRSWAFLDSYIAKSRKANIHIRYTLNASCLGSTQDFKELWDHKLKEDCQELHNIGVDQWTVTSPLLLELLREMFPEDLIEVSTICEVSTPEDLARWKALGANAVCISTSINRDFNILKLLPKVPDIELSLLSNESCLFRCPYRRDCYNSSSHDSGRSEELFGFYPFRRCTEVRLASPTEWLKSRLILPQWMKVYQEQTGISNFKIAYRTHPKEVALPMLRWYMEQDFNGNLLELWPTIAHLGSTVEPKKTTYIPTKLLDDLGFLDHFITSDVSCSSLECSRCGYCNRIYNQMTKIMSTARK